MLPTTMDFKPVGEAVTWRVEKFDAMAAEFGLENESGPDGPKDLQQFVFLCQRYQRLWLLVRRLYGIAPVVLPIDVDPEDVRVHSRLEMEAQGYSVKTDLEALRGFWMDYCRKAESTQAIEETIEGMAVDIQKATGELALDDKVLEEFGFNERMFEISIYDPRAPKDGKCGIVPRPDKENKAERAWFIARLHEWKKMLRDSIGGPLARAALMNEMTLRRLDFEIAVAEPKQRDALYKQREAERRAYSEAADELQKMFPEMAVAQRMTFRAVISDLAVGHRDYYASNGGERKLVDKVCTAAELEWLFRRSVQVEARHRFSLHLAIIECINGLCDPNFRQRFKPNTLKLVDAASRSAVAVVRESLGEKLVDLENGVMPGEGDDFDDFNDAECPHCGGRISAQARRCPECRTVIVWKANENDKKDGKEESQNDDAAGSAVAGATATEHSGAGAPKV
jgi:hypothetical protein